MYKHVIIISLQSCMRTGDTAGVDGRNFLAKQVPAAYMRDRIHSLALSGQFYAAAP